MTYGTTTYWKRSVLSVCLSLFDLPPSSQLVLSGGSRPPSRLQGPLSWLQGPLSWLLLLFLGSGSVGDNDLCKGTIQAGSEALPTVSEALLAGSMALPASFKGVTAGSVAILSSPSPLSWLRGFSSWLRAASMSYLNSKPSQMTWRPAQPDHSSSVRGPPKPPSRPLKLFPCHGPFSSLRGHLSCLCRGSKL